MTTQNCRCQYAQTNNIEVRHSDQTRHDDKDKKNIKRRKELGYLYYL
jgi:hypothetical protein